MINIDGIRDVEKLLHGTHESQNKIQVPVGGEVKEITTRNVGDKWVDSDGNEWEQKNGYAIKLGTAWQQELHKYLNSFPNCQKEVCTCTLPNRLDEKMKAIHGLCFDCVVKMEHKIRLAGKWDEYEKGKLKQNALSWLKEAERDKEVIASELAKAEFTNDFGDVETWDVGKTKEEFLQKIDSEFEEFKTNFIKVLEESLNTNTEKDSGNTEGDTWSI